jgi:hypothetical protein
MKLLIHLSLFLFLSVLVSCSENHTSTGARMAAKSGIQNRTVMNIFGNAKSVHYYNYEKFTADAQSPYLGYYEFDTAGNIIIEKIVPPADSAYSLYYKRDQYGNTIEILKKDASGNPGVLTEYTLDERGNAIVVKETHIKTGEVRTWNNNYKYHSNGNVIEQPSKRTEDGVTFDTRKVYDDSGRVIESSTYINQEFRYGHQVKFNSQGKIIEQKQLDQNRNAALTVIYTYDSAGHELTTREVWSDSARNYFVRRKFDEFGNLTEYIHEDYTGQPDPSKSTRYVYDYDEHNNWIKSTTSSLDGAPRHSIRRKIVYY